MKFTREKVSSLLGHTEVRYTEVVEGTAEIPEPFQVIVDPHGVRLEGKSSRMDNMPSLQAFAKVVSEAYQDYDKLRPTLAKSLSGH